MGAGGRGQCAALHPPCGASSLPSLQKSGRPNWAIGMFQGKEDTAFAPNARQPNLACNHFYWIWNVEERWPDKFWKCDASSGTEFICSDSYWCNW